MKNKSSINLLVFAKEIKERKSKRNEKQSLKKNYLL